MTRVRFTLFAGLLAMASLLGASARADVAVSISGNNSYGNAAGSWGWEFTTTGDLVVTSLGVYDSTGQGLPADTTVGIWRESDQALVGSVVVPSLGSLVDGFRYEAVTPFSLSSSETYRITFWNPNGYSVIGYNGQGVAWAPEVTYLNAGVYNYDSGSYSYPTEITTNNLPKYFGPNFQFTTTAVPEPATFALFAAGVGLPLLANRRRKAAAGK